MSTQGDTVPNPKQCPYCNYVFTEINKCTKHMTKCRTKPIDTNAFKCQCAKTYKYKQGLDKHQAKCTTYQATQTNTTNNNSAYIVAGSANNNTINNTTNNDNSTINTTNNPVININPVGSESYDHLTAKDIDSVLRSGKGGCFKKLAKLMYKCVENHNIAFHNRKDGLVKHVNSDGDVAVGNEPHVINRVVTSVEDKLEEYINEFLEDKTRDASPLGRLLSELSEENEAGIHDKRNYDVIYNLVIMLSSFATTLMKKYEKQRAAGMV